MTEEQELLASPPFPWFGGKTKIAPIIWERFGDVPNFVEPFFGSGAMLRLRPHWPFDEEFIRRETVNDYDGHVCNFWRATQYDPEAVSHYLDWPVNELDLHARGRWLFCRPESKEFAERMRAEDDFYCPKTAGWWCWFVANWIGGLPSVEKNAHRTEECVARQRPHLGRAGQGVSRQLPHLGDAGKGVTRQLPHLGNAEASGACERQSESLRYWMCVIADRLRLVRVCCGNWDRVCGKSVTWNNASPCAVFLDPPYSAEAGRDNNLYSTENASVAHDVREWCLIEGKRDDMRICLAGYAGEGHEALEAAGWDVVAWKSSGGYASQGNGNGKENAHRERLWFSPACLRPNRAQPGLFDGDGEE